MDDEVSQLIKLELTIPNLNIKRLKTLVKEHLIYTNQFKKDYNKLMSHKILIQNLNL